MANTILTILERALDQSTRTRAALVDKSDLLNVRLYGSGAIFDSMQLVNFLLLVEQTIDDEIGKVVSLTSDKAVSRKVSPFTSIGTLLAFIEGELSQNDPVTFG